MKKKDIGKCWQKGKVIHISTLWSSFVGARYRGLLCLAKMFIWNTAQIIKRYADIPKVLGGGDSYFFLLWFAMKEQKSYNLKGRIETLCPYFIYCIARHILSFCLFVSHSFACLYHLFCQSFVRSFIHSVSVYLFIINYIIHSFN